jgi:hypothetical protein
MVIARIFGGLGNQLFIYAAARSLALRWNTELQLDTVSGFEEDVLFHRSFMLDRFKVTYTPAGRMDILLQPSCIGRLTRAVARRTNRALPLGARFYITDDSGRATHGLRAVTRRPRVYLDGYWQDSECFTDYEAVIREELQLKCEPDGKERLLASEMADCDSIAVHFRTLAGAGNDTRPIMRLPHSYYQSCFSELRQRVRDPHLYCFADAALEIGPELTAGIPYTVISHDLPDEHACNDLWLMTQCKHHVIANSTFSWWGAWLGRHPHKIVMAPEEPNRGQSATPLPSTWEQHPVACASNV